MSVAWVVRAGRYGERDSWALQQGFSGGGWGEIPDLTACTTREEVGEVLAKVYADANDGALANRTGQMWALRGRIAPGDLMVMPLKTTKRIAIGLVTNGYEYLAEQDDPDCRHVVRVDWKVTDLPRTAMKQDLLFSLGSALSIFAPSKNHAVDRLRVLLEKGTDPGQVPFMGPALLVGPSKRSLPDDDVDEPELHADIDEIALDRITSKIEEEFAGHGLATLITEKDFLCNYTGLRASIGVGLIRLRWMCGSKSSGWPGFPSVVRANACVVR